MISRIRLRDGVPAQDALRTLRTLISESDAVTNFGGHDSAGSAREAYVRWVENVESQLAQISPTSAT